MSDQLKYRLFQGGYLIGLPLSAIFMSRVYQAGLANNPSEAKLWFALLITTVLACSSCGIGFYYYRSKLRQPHVDDTAVNALSEYGEQLKDEHDHKSPSR